MLSLLWALWSVSAGHAMDNGAVRCAKILISQRDHQRRDSATADAVRALHRFRSAELGAFPFDPSYAAASASSTSADGERRWATARASGILADVVDPRVRVLAFELTRESEIVAEIERRAAIGRALRQNFARRTAAQQIDALLVAGGVTASMSGVFALLAPDPWLALPAALMIPVRHLPERFARAFQAFHWRRDEVRLARGLAGPAGGWRYFSAQVRVPVATAERIWKNGDVDEADVAAFYESVAYPEWTLRAFGARGLVPRPPALPGELGWARFDEVLIKDARGRPRLISIARFPHAI